MPRLAPPASTLWWALFFSIGYRDQIRSTVPLWGVHSLLIVTLVALAIGGTRWTNRMNSTLFKDKVVYTKVTPYQHIAITKRIRGQGLPELMSLYLNGRLQFSQPGRGDLSQLF